MTGNELARAWDNLQAEARRSCQYLGQELTGSLSYPAEGIGEGAEDGSTRAKITKEREELRAAVLKKALTELDPTARPVWSWKQRDKLSSAFLLNTPGAHSSLSTPIFREAVAALLCALSGFCICNAKMLFNKKQVKTIPILLTIP
jgi:hypothetical protein